MVARDNQRQQPFLRTDRLVLTLLDPSRRELMVRYRLSNRQHLRAWEPLRSAEFYTVGYWDLELRHLIRDFHGGRSVCLTILDANQSEVLGVCNFTNLIRGTFQACHLGYSLAERCQDQGLMTEALTAAIDYMFNEMKIHRIMANYMPHNHRSGRLLEKLGFEIEGRARLYLQINGEWEDHILTSLINPVHLNN